ncbi:hypothetical protein K9U40_04900 [Xanthobacter autotrophicus]|uniref:hypothetical protein n=1 Tax=Xanthobacter TaxID=279 RepID=UPI0024AB6E9A|nr:hypothetical protein [Xanthobacter autotrophicus]MDI4663671.1 hypothetical protein [Xanthobacter autotrophicus]
MSIPLIPVSVLKQERGWTDTMVQKFLGDPDQLKPNPNYRSGPKMRLYRLDRIEEAEATELVREALSKARASRSKRSSSALERHNRNRQSLLQAVASIPIEIPSTNLSELIDTAIQHYNRRNIEKVADQDSESSFLKRITCNYIRHELIDYDMICHALRGQVGRQDAYFLLKDRIMENIYSTYPELL